MARGTVKWFSHHKGYGFIAADGEREVFVRHSAIEGSGYRTLNEGEDVEFDIRTGEQGPEAVHVHRLV